MTAVSPDVKLKYDYQLVRGLVAPLFLLHSIAPERTKSFNGASLLAGGNQLWQKPDLTQFRNYKITDCDENRKRDLPQKYFYIAVISGETKVTIMAPKSVLLSTTLDSVSLFRTLLQCRGKVVAIFIQQAISLLNS